MFLHGQQQASPAIAQLVEHLTVECCSNQMVPGSIPGAQIFVSKRAPLKSVREGLQIQSLFRNLIPRIPSHSYACCETASCATIMASFGFADDTLAERLRRRPAKPMGSPRVGSNPTGVVSADLRFPRACMSWLAAREILARHYSSRRFQDAMPIVF